MRLMRCLLRCLLPLAWACALPTGGLAPSRDGGVAPRDANADSGASDSRVPDGDVPDSGMADTGTIDSGVPDTGVADTGMADTGALDSGGDCSGFTPHCEGETRVVCDASGVRRQDCTAISAYCDGGGPAPTCVDWACTPDAVSCTAGDEETRCDPRGIAQTVSTCARGCDAGTGACRPQTPCGLTVDGTIRTGRMTFDTCTAGDDATPVNGCTRVNISGGDRILRLDVPQANTYRIDFKDVRGGADLDALVYLRTDCADAASELACNDDRPMTTDSRIELDLEPGEYFIILDSFRDTDESEPGRCGAGEVDVSIR